MPYVLTDWLQVIASLGALLSGLGLIGVMGSFIVLLRQTRAIETATMAATYQGLITTGSAVNALMFEYPELIDVLHQEPPGGASNEESFPLDQTDKRAVLLATQMLDYFELILMTMATLPPHLQQEWRDFIRGQLRRMPYLRRLAIGTDWYTDELRQLAREDLG